VKQSIPFLRIAERFVGGSNPAFVIAELSGNHGHDFDKAARMIAAAAEAGANAIKLQTYRPDTITIDCDRPEFWVKTDNVWSGKTLFQLYEEAATPWEWQPRLKRVAEDLGLILFSTPFDPTAVDFLESMNVPAYKIASFEVIDLPLVERIARTGKPIIASTGMATLSEIDEMVKTTRSAGNRELALLRCVSAYPADPGEMNLRTIPHLSSTFGVVVGLSDHTLGATTAVAAVALGAKIIEKHFILRRSDGGPDAFFSMEPGEFAAMVKAVRETEEALGEPAFGPGPKESRNLVFRRSLFAVEDIRKGETITEKNVRSIRPGHGLAPKHLPAILGRRAKMPISRGTPLAWDMLES
jgi:pseudaminic acid synthase